MLNISTTSNASYLQGWRSWMQAAGRSQGTINQRIYHVERFIKSGGNIDTANTQDLIQWISNPRWSASTKRAARSSLRAFFEWAHTYAALPHNPAATLPPVIQPRGLPRPARDTDILTAIRTAPPRERLMIELMAFAGLRRCEVAKVHSRDLTADLLRVTGKGGHVRMVPLPRRIAVEVKQAAGWVFPGQIGGHLAPATVGKLVSKHLPDGLTPHQLRHRYGTSAYARSRDIRAVQTLLGHARLDTTAVYVAVANAAIEHVASTTWTLAA